MDYFIEFYNTVLFSTCYKIFPLEGSQVLLGSLYFLKEENKKGEQQRNVEVKNERWGQNSYWNRLNHLIIFLSTVPLPMFKMNYD